jgi:hypothetical protein
MKQLVGFLAVLFCPGILIAQINYSSSYFSQTYNIQNNQSEAFVEIIDGVATMRYSQHEHLVRGSPYLYDEFLFGVMTTVEAVRIEGLRYRYDIYSDEMQFILKDDTASITRPLTLRSIQIGEQKFVYDVFQTGHNTVSAGYFELIEEGKLSALIRREKELDQDSYCENYGGGGGTKDFFYKENKTYYLKLNQDVAWKITNKKRLLEAIPDHRKEIKSFMKSEKISLRKPKDIKQLVSYYNTLTADQTSEQLTQ